MAKKRHVHALIRFDQKERLERFQTRGQIYMNTLKFFNELESSDPQRGDRSEGLHSSHPLRTMKTELLVAGNWQPFPFVSGQLRFPDVQAEEINVFCLYALTETREMRVDYRMLGFGSEAVIVLDVAEFIRRASQAIKIQKWPYESALIDYVEKDGHSGFMGPFRKYADRKYESEFRIAVRSRLKRPIENFEIGDLRDITQIGDARDFCAYYRIGWCSEDPARCLVSFGADSD